MTSHDWPPLRALAAVASDAFVLTVLFLLFSILDRRLQPKSFAARSHKALHFAIALAAIALATSAQVLYKKTGEVLDIGIVSFFLTNFKDLTGASQSVVDREVLLIAIACFGFYLLSLVQIRTPLLKSIQYALFFSPLLLLTIDSIYDISENSGARPLLVTEKSLYKGSYIDHATVQYNWLKPEQPFWHDGIMTGLATYAAPGITEYEAIERTSKPNGIYSAPHGLSSPRISPNILLVLLESTRADVVGAYATTNPHSSESHTPFIDKLASNGWLYEQAYTTIPHTSKALVAIYCGTFATFETDAFESTESHYPINCLPKLLEPFGYRSAHFQTAPGTFEDRSRFLLNAGFGHSVVQEDLDPDHQKKYGYLGLDDHLLVAPMLDWMTTQRRSGNPFFASMLTVMTHHPYVSPDNIQPLQDPAKAKQSYLRKRPTETVFSGGCG